MGSGELLLGIRWDAPSWRRAPLLVNRVLRSFHDVPLHWALPSLPGDDIAESEVMPVLRQRFASAGDVLLSVGFAGACHPLLSLLELDREIAWGLRNPWSTGVAQAFQRKPAGMLPRWADLDRPEAAKIYLRHGLGTIGVPLERPLGFSAVNGLRLFPFVAYPGPLPRGEVEQGRRIRRLLQSAPALFVLMDLDRLPPAPQAAERVIEELGRLLRRAHRPFRVLTDRGDPAAERAGCACAGAEAAATWELRGRLDFAARLRSRRRQSTRALRALLSALSCSSPLPAPAESAEPRHDERGLIAHMQGEASLEGERFSLMLVGGRPCGLRDRLGPLTPTRPASSWLKVGGRLVPFHGQSAFSFEDATGTGLREELAVEPAGSLALEYYFRGEDPRLWIEGTAAFPGLEPSAMVEESALFAFTVAELGQGESAHVQAETPEGSRFVHVMPDGSGWHLLAGSTFRVRVGRATVVLGPGSGCGREQSDWTVMLFRVTRGPGRIRFLEACPAGSTVTLPASRLAGGRERFSLSVGIEES